MKKIILFVIIFLICSPHLVLAETVTLSTYYPAPFGTYDRVRLVPRDPIAGACRVGTMYTENVLFTLQFCSDDGSGVNDGAWGVMPGLWENDGGNEITLVGVDTVDDFHVGIGDSNPNAVLEVSSSGQGFDLFMLSTDDADNGDLFIVDATGQVGIGTITPEALLDIRGDVQIISPAGQALNVESSATATNVNIDNTNTGVSSVRFLNSGASRWIAGNDGADLNTFKIEAAAVFGLNPYFAIDWDDGNIDIGDSADLGAVPEEKLNVRGGINLRDDGTNWGKLMVEFEGSGAGGYYAVYAP